MKQWRQLITVVIVCGLVLACKVRSPVAVAPTATTVRLDPSIIASASPLSELQQPPLSRERSAQASVFLDQLAEDTWTYLSSSWATSNHLPWSWRSASLSGGDYANTAEIGLYALSWLAAYDLQQPWSPPWEQVKAEVNAVLDQLRAWQTGSQPEQPHGANAYGNSAFYQWYWVSWTPPVVGVDSGDNHLVPSIDNAWLAACLITIREYAEAQGESTLAQKANDILTDMDFSLWYHADTHRFSWGGVEDPQGGTLADYYSNENRIINFVARAMGHLSAKEFQLSLEALVHAPGTYEGITVDRLAWDGSYFTYATPTLFIRESSTVYGTSTLLPATQAQMAYAQAQGYDAWGLSDCYDVGNEGYVQQGGPPTAMSGSPETRPGLVTPHASALALITPLSSEAITNLQVLSDTFTCAYDSFYGFRDSVMVHSGAADYGQCSNRFSALAQEWMFLAIVNHDSGFIWDYFYRDSGVRAAHQEMFQYSYLPLVLNKAP